MIEKKISIKELAKLSDIEPVIINKCTKVFT